MEKFLVLTTLTDRTKANRTCAALEDAGLSVMLEHITIRDADTDVSGFRVLVPSEYTQQAKMIAERVEATSPLFAEEEFSPKFIH